jgi:hypothetical protein
LIQRRFSRHSHGRLNAAATRSNFLIGGAARAFFKFSSARAGKDRMRVRIYKARHNNATTGIDYFAVSAN